MFNIKYRLRKWLLSDENNHKSSCSPKPVLQGGNSAREIELGNPVRFIVAQARGGVVVQTSRYDQHHDHNDIIHHVIHDDSDVAQEVGRIVAMEMLKG